MFRADDPDADANANGTGKAGYTEGEPGVTAPTPVRADALNNIQEELCLAVEDGGLTLDKTVKRQLSQALKLRAARMVMGGGWTVQSLSGTPGNLHAGVWQTRASIAGDGFVVVGEAGACQTSPDGVTWTSRTTGSANAFYAATMRTDLVVIAGLSGQIYTSSTSGSTWSSRSAAGSSTFRGAAYSPSLDLFCLVGDGGTVETSPDGVTWTARTLGGSSTEDMKAVAWDPVTALFCAVGGNTNTDIQTSSDGITWVQQTPVHSTGILSGVAALPDTGGFTAAGTGSQMEYSADGTTWVDIATVGTTGADQLDFVAPIAGTTVAVDGGDVGTTEKAAQITPDGTAVVGLYARSFQAAVVDASAIIHGYDQYLVIGQDGSTNGAVALSDVGGF